MFNHTGFSHPFEGVTDSEHSEMEVFWIFHLNTRKPAGLHFEWDVSRFYD